ncbi:MAG: holo-ACP synthase [candidate division Zixibacteria bacterium]|nr:holo-ACP synthase [candidate division Zixibacteria bacterium]
MISAIGLDIVDSERIVRLLDRFGNKFAKRILGPIEISYYSSRIDRQNYLAGRFAAKEAVIKGLGIYLKQRPAWRDIQILNDSTGRPVLQLTDALKKKLGRTQCHLSIAHEKKTAVAVAIFTEE